MKYPIPVQPLGGDRLEYECQYHLLRSDGINQLLLAQQDFAVHRFVILLKPDFAVFLIRVAIGQTALPITVFQRQCWISN